MSGARMLAAAALTLALAGPPAARADTLKVASKSFTESVILGELATQLLRESGLSVEHRRELGGTRVLFNALEQGEIDVYAEYTGTLTHEILEGLGLTTLEEIRRELARRGLRATPPLGFNNAYAIGMRADRAEALGIRSISDLLRHPELRLGLGNEFLDRGDGWPSLRRRYGLPQTEVRGLDHDLAYRALERGEIDAMDVYTTDAEIAYYGLRTLDDDLRFFRTYHAVWLYRADLDQRAPAAAAALAAVAGRIDEERMRRMNAQVKLEGASEARVAAAFAGEAFGFDPQVRERSVADRLWLRTKEHLFLVGVAMFAGMLVAIPLGILAARRPRLGQVILALTGILQTVPALALLVFMIPLLGIYEPPAIAALFLYSLLPMVHNTVTGLRGIPPSLEESAEALGLPPLRRLLRIELPLASPSILTGVKTSTVISIGFATLGALIGAGGYGQPIFTGIRLDDFGLILEGAVPAALLALAVQGTFAIVERVVVPRGLRLRRGS